MIYLDRWVLFDLVCYGIIAFGVGIVIGWLAHP